MSKEMTIARALDLVSAGLDDVTDAEIRNIARKGLDFLRWTLRAPSERAPIWYELVGEVQGDGGMKSIQWRDGAGAFYSRHEPGTLLYAAQPVVLFNPYTGQPRDPRDIESDPHGKLIVKPGAPLAVAQ